MMDVSVHEHALNLQSKAYEIRADYVKVAEEDLSKCLNDDERINYLNLAKCFYFELLTDTMGACGIFDWYSHYTKSFIEFAKWHVDNRGWKRDFQGLDYKAFATCWAVNWMVNWTGQQVGDICSRRIDERENRPVEVSTDVGEITDSGLTERERVLIHCYKQQPAILRGQPGYQDYMTYARPGDRTSYPDGSNRKATSLIRSIEKILSYLSDTERQQAEYEINTIRVNIS